MSFPVKFLVAGEDFSTDPTAFKPKKGDVVQVVRTGFDWGSATVANRFIRLIISDYPGDTQEDAEAAAKQKLDESWKDAFTYTEVAGATAPDQRYRIEAIPELANDLSQEQKFAVRDAILARFGGTVENQGTNFLEIDTFGGIPLDEFEFIVQMISFRRWYFDSALIDQALQQGTPGQPLEFTRTFNNVKNKILDRLKA